MGVDLRKTSHILFFAAFLPLISFGVGWVFAQIPNVPFWVETISPLAAYGLLFALFDNYLWHWPLFRWLGIVSQPDVRGRWLGEQTSSFKDENGKARTSRVILEVEQRFSGMSAMTYYKNWQSNQMMTSIVDVAGQPTIFMMYESEPKAVYEGDAGAHKGVIRLTQRPNTTLTGTYFNGAGRHGELEFYRTRYTLHRTFEQVRTAKKALSRPA